jgi:hypothetical protein
MTGLKKLPNAPTNGDRGDVDDVPDDLEFARGHDKNFATPPSRW